MSEDNNKEMDLGDDSLVLSPEPETPGQILARARSKVKSKEPLTELEKQAIEAEYFEQQEMFRKLHGRRYRPGKKASQIIKEKLKRVDQHERAKRKSK